MTSQHSFFAFKRRNIQKFDPSCMTGGLIAFLIAAVGRRTTDYPSLCIQILVQTLMETSDPATTASKNGQCSACASPAPSCRITAYPSLGSQRKHIYE